MFRNHYFIIISVLSGIIGAIAEYFGIIQVHAVVLLILITIDTVTGMAKALAEKSFSSAGLMSFIKKIIIYCTAIVTVRLLEATITDIVKTSLLSQITIAALAVTEAVSILENLAFLGVPISITLFWKIIEKLKLGGVREAMQSIEANIQKYIREMDDIIKYSLPAFDDKQMRNLLEVKFDIWRKVAFNICHIVDTNTSTNNEILYFKIISLIESGMKEMHDKWEFQGIPGSYINSFNNEHSPKVDDWIIKIKGICLSNDPTSTKKEKLIESILLILYQTLHDARKGMYSL